MIQRPLRAMILGSLLLVGVAAAVLTTGCGTSCPEIAAERQAFDRRERADAGPDARMAIPFASMDRVLQGRLRRRPPLPIELPTAKLGVATKLALRIDGITTHAAAPDRLGVTVRLVLYDERPDDTILALEVDTSIAPVLERNGAPFAQAPVLRLRVTPADLGEVRPRPTAGGTERLARFLRDKLPPIARHLATDALTEALAQEVLDFVASDVWPHAKDPLLGREPLVDTRLALPDLPIRALALSSAASALVVDITSDLPDARALSPGFDRAGDRMVLRLSGGTLTGLINRAMDARQVPSRFDGKGKPDPDGIWEARVGWSEGGTPLLVHLWQMRDACTRATVAARVGLALQGDTVRVRVWDGRLQTVAGPAFAEAFYWLERIFGDALAFTFDTASFVRFDAGDDQVQLRLARITLERTDLVVALDLGVAEK